MSQKMHADLGASKAERWMNCPGSVRLCTDIPDTTSPYAVEGTAAHALAERALRKNLDCDVWQDTEIEGVTVTDEMCEAVQVYVDYVRKIVREQVAIGNENVQRFIERRFNLARLNPPAPMFGTSDFALFNEINRHLHVIDYKHGAGVAVDAHENAQEMYYALGVVVAMGKRPETITATIVQPRAHHRDGIIRSYDFDYQTLIDFKKTLFTAAAKTQEPDAPLAVGGWCRFCPAQAVCPAQHQNAVEVAQTDFDAIAYDGPPLPEALSREQLSIVLERAPIVEDWIKAVRNYVSQRLDLGEAVPGWKLVPKRAMRRWKDEEAAEQEMKELLGDNAYTRKLVSPAQAEKALKAEKIKAEIDELVEKVSSGTNLVPDSDERAGLLPSAVTDFDVV